MVDMGKGIRLQFHAETLLRRLFFTLVGIELFILGMDLIFNHYQLIQIGALQRLFNITREDGLANFFSSFQLICVGAVLYLVYLTTKTRTRRWRNLETRGWLILSAFFTFMGFDDATKFHERIGTTADVLFDGESREIASAAGAGLLDFFPSYTWQLVFGPFFAAMGAFILWFLWRKLQDDRARLLFVGGLALYVIAVGLDFVEGLGTSPYQGVAHALSLTPAEARHLSKAYEETFENFGTTLFLICFLQHLLEMAKDGVLLEGAKSVKRRSRRA
jgi:hypothetical protein